MEKIIIHTDGGSRGNPGPAGAGATIADAHGEVLAEVSDYLGKATNNIAEYEALVRALTTAKKMFGEKLCTMHVDVRMDSELIIRQMNGIYRVKDPNLQERFLKIKKMIAEDMPNISFTHVYREKNKHADRLVNAAIDAAVKK